MHQNLKRILKYIYVNLYWKFYWITYFIFRLVKIYTHIFNMCCFFVVFYIWFFRATPIYKQRFLFTHSLNILHCIENVIEYGMCTNKCTQHFEMYWENRKHFIFLPRKFSFQHILCWRSNFATQPNYILFSKTTILCN